MDITNIRTENLNLLNETIDILSLRYFSHLKEIKLFLDEIINGGTKTWIDIKIATVFEFIARDNQLTEESRRRHLIVLCNLIIGFSNKCLEDPTDEKFNIVFISLRSLFDELSKYKDKLEPNVTRLQPYIFAYYIENIRLAMLNPKISIIRSLDLDYIQNRQISKFLDKHIEELKNVDVVLVQLLELLKVLQPRINKTKPTTFTSTVEAEVTIIRRSIYGNIRMEAKTEIASAIKTVSRFLKRLVPKGLAAKRFGAKIAIEPEPITVPDPTEIEGQVESTVANVPTFDAQQFDLNELRINNFIDENGYRLEKLGEDIIMIDYNTIINHENGSVAAPIYKIEPPEYILKPYGIQFKISINSQIQSIKYIKGRYYRFSTKNGNIVINNIDIGGTLYELMMTERLKSFIISEGSFEGSQHDFEFDLTNLPHIDQILTPIESTPFPSYPLLTDEEMEFTNQIYQLTILPDGGSGKISYEGQEYIVHKLHKGEYVIEQGNSGQTRIAPSEVVGNINVEYYSLMTKGRALRFAFAGSTDEYIYMNGKCYIKSYRSDNWESIMIDRVMINGFLYYLAFDTSQEDKIIINFQTRVGVTDFSIEIPQSNRELPQRLTEEIFKLNSA